MCDALPPDAAKYFPEIHAELLQDGGTVLFGESLRKATGFKSVQAMAKAIARKKLLLPFFRMPPRRGLFVLSRDVAYYLALQRAAAESREGGATMP